MKCWLFLLNTVAMVIFSNRTFHFSTKNINTFRWCNDEKLQITPTQWVTNKETRNVFMMIKYYRYTLHVKLFCFYNHKYKLWSSVHAMIKLKNAYFVIGKYYCTKKKNIPRELVVDWFENILFSHTGRYWSYTFKTENTISERGYRWYQRRSLLFASRKKIDWTSSRKYYWWDYQITESKYIILMNFVLAKHVNLDLWLSNYML